MLNLLYGVGGYFMFKFLKNKKFIKIISFLLIFAFSINLVGCDHQNDVTGGQAGGGKKHYSVGVGNDVTGYGVYAQSTFDKMTKELFMGYLLSWFVFSSQPCEVSKKNGFLLLFAKNKIGYCNCSNLFIL